VQVVVKLAYHLWVVVVYYLNSSVVVNAFLFARFFIRFLMRPAN